MPNEKGIKTFEPFCMFRACDAYVSVVVFPVRVARKPSFAHTLLLLKQFMYAPEARKAHHAEQGTEIGVAHKQGGSHQRQPHEQEYPPRACPKIVFRLDDDGMEQTYDNKGGEAYE